MASDAVVTPTKEAVSAQKRGSDASAGRARRRPAAGAPDAGFLACREAGACSTGPRTSTWIGMVTTARTTARATSASRQPRRSVSTLVNGWNTKLDSPATSVTAVIARR